MTTGNYKRLTVKGRLLLHNTNIVKPLYIDFLSVLNYINIEIKQSRVKMLKMYQKVTYKCCHSTNRTVVLTATQIKLLKC